MKLETKSFDLKANVSDEGKGIIHAVVSIFGNEDSVKDVMVKGSFARSIKEGKDKGRLPPGVWAHDWERPIAKTMDAWETDEGLNVIGQFNLETKDGQDAYSNVKNELFTEYSFGFQRIKDAEEVKNGVTYVKDLNWFEWSPVLVGANRQTYTAGVKRYDTDDMPAEKEIETYLRDAKGFSRQAAKICISGLKALYQRDVEEATSTTERTDAEEPPTTAEPAAEDREPDELIELQPEEVTEEPPIKAAPVVLNLEDMIRSQTVSAHYRNLVALQAKYGLHGESEHNGNSPRAVSKT